MQHTCNICQSEFKSLWGLSSHSSQKHNISSKETYLQYNPKPLCKCGCEGEPTYLGIKKGFREYIKGHHSRVNNNWGHNKESQRKSKETQKKMYENGELVVWNKGLTKEDDNRLDYGHKISSNKERSKKISNSLKGRKRPQHVLDSMDKGMREYWSKPINREKQRDSRLQYMNTNQYDNKTKLELSFESLLQSIGVEFVFQYTMCGYNFDYYLPNGDIIIEVDGDFWHCNPTKYPKPVYESQVNTLKNDKKKNLICQNTKGITLLRFWETDIKERPEWVKEELLKHL